MRALTPLHSRQPLRFFSISIDTNQRILGDRMVRFDQIVISSQFIRHFRDLANYLSDGGRSLLIA